MRPRYYVLIGQTPVPEGDALKWAAWFETADRIVKQEHVGVYFVSTVFLGVDHNWFEGPALLFETMVFADGDSHGLHCERCAIWMEAEAQHERIAAECRRRLVEWKSRRKTRRVRRF